MACTMSSGTLRTAGNRHNVDRMDLASLLSFLTDKSYASKGVR